MTPRLPVLVKLGGTLLDSADSRQALAAQIARARERGVPIVVVHGGGKQMTRYLAERGIESRFVNGLRVTTPEAVDAVLKVFTGSVNHELVAALNGAGALAVGLSGIDALLAEAEPMDPALGAVGRVTRCNPALVQLLSANGYVPVVACVAGDRRGQVYNVNADQMAVACAAALGAGQLIFLTDVAGVLDASGRVRPVLTAAESEALVAAGVATGGMQAKLNAAIAALRSGVELVRIAPGRGRERSGSPAGRRAHRHSHDPRGGCGMISGLYADAFVEPPDAPTKLRARKAVMHDIPLILDLINAYAAKGIMLARTEFELSEAIRDFSVVRQGETLLGCGALHFYTPTIGEIRSLAVEDRAKTKGVGRVLVEALVEEAMSTNLTPYLPSLMWWISSAKSASMWWNAALFR